MHNVINFIKLILLVSLGLSYLSGQGWLVVGPLLHGSLLGKKKLVPLLQEIPLMMIAGLIINYGIVLILHSLKISLIASSILAVFGFACFLVYLLRTGLQELFSSDLMNKLIGITFICLLFMGPILVLPLTAQDARSIWFFHAKMIYAAGTFSQAAGWQNPYVIELSHVDYPNLMSTLAAQVDYVMGFWNEYLPKIAMFFMLVPAVTLLLGFARRSFSFVILLLLLPFSSTILNWNGHMDSFLAFYFALAMLLLGRYFKTSTPIDLISSVFCLCILLYIKNEGVLAAIVGVCTVFLVLLIRKNLVFSKKFFLNNWKYLLVLVILLLPFGLWSFYKWQWGLSNDLGVGTAQSFLRIISRLKDGSYRLVITNVLIQVEEALMSLGLLYFASIAWKKSLPRQVLPAVIAAVIYCLGMIVVYLMTPYELGWHVRTSIVRTMLSVNACLFIAVYYILNSLENTESAAPDPNTPQGNG